MSRSFSETRLESKGAHARWIGAGAPAILCGVKPSRAAAFALAVASLGLLGAWFDLLPGGWRLRQLAGRGEAARYREQRAERLAQFRCERAPAGAVVFLGSSTIERFPLDQAFPGAPVLGRGIGNEPLAELALRLEESVPPDAGGLVLYAGSVEFRAGPAGGVEALAAEFGALLARLRRLRPQTALCVLGILPERAMSAARVAELRSLNARLAEQARGLGAVFVATDRPPLAEPDGSLSEAFSCDRLHLDADGYEVLAAWLRSEAGPLSPLLAP